MTDAQKQNAKQMPKIFYARHMQPGLCGYENETILVDTDAVKRMMPSGVGKPIYVNHQNVDLDKLKEQAAGYITESFYNELDGWAWFKCLAVDDAAHQAIGNNWSVSNAYIPSEFGSGGLKNNCPYARSVLNADFTHLALVPNPRYEGACIMSPDEFKIYQDAKKRELDELQNSLPSKGTKPMFKLFKNKQEAVTEIDADTLVEVDGKHVSIAEMINSVKKNAEDEAALKKAEEEKANKTKMNDDQEVDVDGETMPLRELMNRYKKMNEKKNAEEKEKEEKKNAEEEEAKKKAEKEEEEKTNSKKTFDELKNAHNRVSAPLNVDTSMDKVARGKARYGSAA